MPRVPLSGRRWIAAVLALLMVTMLLVTSHSSPPVVSVGQLAQFDEGTTVILAGVVVEIAAHDSGGQSLVLADMSTSDTARVYCSQGVRELPSHILGVGDEALVEGEVSKTGTAPMLFATTDGLAVSRKAHAVLSVEALSRNWALFEGDGFAIAGMVTPGSVAGEFRLADPDLQHTIALRSDSVDFAGFVGKRVTLEAALRLDQRAMSLVLIASSATPGLSQQAFSSGLAMGSPCQEPF